MSKRTDKNLIVGLDIGTSKIVALVGEVGNDGEIEVMEPVGFVSDHVEVIWDLDNEAQETCDELGVSMIFTGKRHFRH